jgi:excinuclease UvrABC ATPase subunit
VNDTDRFLIGRLAVVEYHLDVIKTADHVIDLGPQSGRGAARWW